MLIDQGNPYLGGSPAVLKLELDDFRFELSVVNRQALGRQAQWTVLGYMAADCDLAPLMFDDLLEMKSVGSNADAHVLALFDGPLLADSFMARLVPSSRLGEDLIMRFNELRTNRPDTLTLAISIANAFPARHRIAILSGHGKAWQGALLDMNAGMHYRAEPGALTLPAPAAECDRLLICSQLRAQDQLNAVIETQLDKRPQGIDILAFDACYMGNIEAVLPLYDQAPVLLVCEGAMPGEGLAYGAFLRLLQQSPEMQPAELAARMVDETEHYYRAKPDRHGPPTIVALNSKRLPFFVGAFVTLVQALLDSEHPEVMHAVRNAIRNSWRSPKMGLLDLKGFVMNLHEGLPKEIAFKARSTLDRFDDMVLAGRGQTASGPHGLSIYAPEPDRFEWDYLQTAQELPLGLGLWTTFLRRYYASSNFTN